MIILWYFRKGLFSQSQLNNKVWDVVSLSQLERASHFEYNTRTRMTPTKTLLVMMKMFQSHPLAGELWVQQYHYLVSGLMLFLVRAKKITCLFFIERVEWCVREFRVITLTNHDTR